MNNCDELAAKNLLSPVLVLAREFNNFFLNKLKLEGDKFKRLVIDGYQVGLVPNQILTELEKHYPQVFHIYRDAVELSPSYGDYDSRSNIVSKILQDFRKQETFITLKGWRDECYEVKCGFDDPPLLKMERSATCLFGIRQYGVSINGCVRHPTKGLCLWLQKRSPTKQTWPGRLDNMVGGGLAVGYSVIETALKEAKEEASIPPNLLKNLKAAGTVSFYFESERGLFPNTEFVYDLELPLDFQPENEDGEVESFHLVTAAEAKDICLSAEFKTTSCPVTLDFLVRHSIINSHNEPDLPQLLELLHVPLHSIYKRIN